MPLGGGLSIASAGAGIIEGGIEMISGAKKLKKDKEELSRLNRPFYKIQNEYYENKNIAASNAMSGLPEETKKYLTDKSDQGLGAGIEGILKAGGRPEDIGKLFSVYKDSIDKTGAEDADRHLKNIEYYMEANKNLAGQKNIQFGINELQPYEEKLKEITQRRAADEKSIWDGANTIIGSTSALGTSMSNQSLIKSQKGNLDSQAAFYDRMFSGSDPFEKISAPSAAQGEIGALPPWLK